MMSVAGKEEVTKAIVADGDETLAVTPDIAVPAEMETPIQKLVNQWRRLDIVFANAGIKGVRAPIDALTPEEWQKTVNINLNGMFYTVK